MAALYLLTLVLCLGAATHGLEKITDLDQAKDALDEYNRKAAEVFYKSTEAAWTFNTNITDHNEKLMLDAGHESSLFLQQAAKNMSRFNTTSMPPNVKRQFAKILDIGTSSQTDDVKMKRLGKVQSQMESIYSTAKACLSPGECLPLEPDLTQILAESRDYDRLLKVWVAWRDASGKEMKDLYAEFVSLSNEALRMAGYSDTGEYWRADYEMDNFEEEVKRMFDEVHPLYEQLHAYVRRKLRAMYGKDKFPSTGQIPAHLLGNMWAQTFDHLTDDLAPFKNKTSLDVTDEMKRQNYTYLTIFQKADDFFKSIGLIEMPEEFWNKSMLFKPKGRDVVCHASAWDFYNRKDFRVKQCTEVTQKHFETAHHEMGHIEYYLQYKDLPLSFRRGANPGFHEAVGDVMSLSVQTPKHMQSINLLKDVSDDYESDINFLMNMALQKIAFLPFGYLIDQWRWSVFRGDTKPDSYTDDWWKLRCKLQGISPPVKRGSDDFDPGAKYHIPANTAYIRYFMSYIIQFQFHKAACAKAGHQGPLHQCDIYNSMEAGKAIGDMLKLGSSEPWPEAMEQLTGQRTMSAKPLMEYFQPLLKFLKEENGDDHGWKDECPTFGSGSGTLTLSMPVVAVLVLLNYLAQRKMWC